MSVITELILPVFTAFFACTGFSLIFNIRGVNMLLASLGGALSWMVYLLTEAVSSDIVACFVAGAVICLYSEIVARPRRTPSTCFLIIGLLPLVPGASIYYTMKFFVQGQYVDFANKGMNTLSCAGAIALGVMWIISIVRMYLHVRMFRKFKK